MENDTKQILSKIYQELMVEVIKNKDEIFIKKYTIPSINYNSDSKDKSRICFASDIEIELYQMMKQFDYKVFFSSYKDIYFFSNNAKRAKDEMLLEVGKKENIVERKEQLKQKLYEKVEKELTEFKESLKQKTPEEIIESAYELVVKEEIIGQLKEISLDEQKLSALLESDELLTEFYEDWRNADGQLGEVIFYTMIDTVETIMEDYNTNNKEKIEESR